MNVLILALTLYFVNDHGTCTKAVGTVDQFNHAQLAKRGIGHRGIYTVRGYQLLKPPRPKVTRTITL
jgi:hypothetical protein